MSKKGLIGNIRTFIKKLIRRKKPLQSDEVELSLPGLTIRMKRKLNIKDPHEVTVVVPRAEFRKKLDKNSDAVEYEIILNSITVVHAPRHPPERPAS
ncbi:MAG: hypothetical protein PWP45_925 [Tepidanaerobacteraceae bacterium]|nr:hypothetical protein [Tepidanaerobacteraceae bacterium]